MSGHSKWATTKHKKAIIDAKRSKQFAKLIKNIEVAARFSTKDPTKKPVLYDAIYKAKKNSVPGTSINRACKRGAGEESNGTNWQSIIYEGYGPNGVALMVECLTDSRNRTTNEVRIAMNRNGGSMADPGSVSYIFIRKGVISIEKGKLNEENLLITMLKVGAEEINDIGNYFEIISPSVNLQKICASLKSIGVNYISAETHFQPLVDIKVDFLSARKVCRLIEALEDNDEVQEVNTNMYISE